MQISARNQLPGTVKAVHPGAINSEVIIDIGDAQVVCVITNDSVKRLGLVAGKKAYAVVKATDVMVAID
ncbi:MAG: TOBE domain-containing protein [Casimicrobiaceae bacterium]